MFIFCFETQSAVNPESIYLLSRKQKQKQKQKQKNSLVLDN